MPIDYGALARQHGGSVVDDDSDGMLTPGNIDLSNRPRVRNKDGSISTVRSISVNMDGKEYLIPTVTDDGRVVSDDEAVKLFKRTGKHLGVFDSAEHATAYAEGLHSDQSKAIGKGVDYAALASQHGGKAVEQEAVPEQAFPTPGETAATFAGGAVRALPGMAMGMVEGATAPFMAVPREVAALVTGGPSPTMTALRESAGHVRSALAPGDAGPGRRLAEAVSAVPGAAPIVKGTEEILTPAYKTATEGVGTVTPAEMKTAAETGGAATAGLAVPEIAKGAGKVSPATVGKVLKFTAEHAAKNAVPGGVVGKVVSAFILTPEIRAKLGTVIQDSIINAVQRGNQAEAAAAVAKALEKHPELAEIHAQKVAEAVAEPTPPMRDTSPAAVSARAAERAARQQAALRGERPDGSKINQSVPAAPPPESILSSGAVAERLKARAESPTGPPASRMTPEELAAFRERMRPQMTPEESRAAIAARIEADRAKRAGAKPEPKTVQVPEKLVKKTVAAMEKRGRMPEPGNVTMGTNMGGKARPIPGQPLTPKQREMRIKQMEAAEAAGLDIWDAFGVTKDN